MEKIYKCPKCGEKENLHFNYDYNQQHRPIKDVLCNDCGEVFEGNMPVDVFIAKAVSEYPELEGTMNLCEEIIQKRTGKMNEEEWQAAERAQTGTKDVVLGYKTSLDAQIFDKQAQEYYNETYKNKINLVEIPQEQLEKERNPNYKYFSIDEPKQENCCTPIGQIKRYVDCIGCDRKPKQNEPIDMSDEEIMKGAKEWYNKEGAYSASAIALKTWVYAIRWYREQLKKPKNEIND
jgi:hypothetical protein